MGTLTAFNTTLAVLLLLAACNHRPSAASPFVLEIVRSETRPDWPAYRVVVRDDGSVLFDGRANVATLGPRKRGTSPLALAKLREQLRDSGVFGVAKDCCDGPTNLTGQEVGLSAASDGRTATARFPYVPSDQGQSGRLSRLADDLESTLGIRSLITPLPSPRGLE